MEKLPRDGILCIFLIVLLQSVVHCQSPPRVDGSYMAYGEVVETMEDTAGFLSQIAFEENYDANAENAAFRVWIMGLNFTFIENFKTNQTFRYSQERGCELLTVGEWVQTSSPPSLLKYEDINGTVRFSLKQLFSLDDKYLQEKNVSDTWRGIPARKWMYKIVGKEEDGTKRTISVYAYWSDGSWDSTSSKAIVPLGFIVTKMTYRQNVPGVKLHEQFINVFGFVHDEYNHKVFEPVQGVLCPNRVQTLKFPNVNGWQAMSIHSEFLLPDYQEIKYIDNWFDPTNQLLRSDIERIKDEDPLFETKERKYQSEIAIGELGVVFRLNYFKGRTGCTVVPIKDYDFDVQNLFNIKLSKKEWSMGKFFGLNDTQYVYTGKTLKRDIPCHMFQGVRKDWPEPSANVTSLWEWCFNVNMDDKDAVDFRPGEFGLISAQVNITDSNKNPDFPTGFRMIHHFYHVNYNRDPAIMDATSFEISRCFNETQKRPLQFTVEYEINDDNLYLVENATSDTSFLQKWKSIIYRYTQLPQSSLRISNVQSTVVNKKLYVKFLILGVHEGLPEDIKKKQIGAIEAERNLRNSVDQGSVFIFHSWKNDGKSDKIGVLKHSVTFQINQTFIPQTLKPTPVPPATTSLKPITLRTVPPRPDQTSRDVSNPGSSTTPKPEGKDKIYKYTGHKKGAVAGVSIAMLLVGISIGSFGTFYKYNGLPSCMKFG